MSPSQTEMEKILNKMDKMELSLMSKMQETRSSLIDQLKKINEKIDSQEVAKAGQVPSQSDSDLNPLDIYKEIDWLGGGVSGEVLLVLDEGTREQFAMKRVVLKNNIIPPDIAREISLLYDLDHVNIIKLKKVYPYKRKLYLLMEDAGTDLHCFLKKEESAKITTEDIKDWLRQLLSALSYLHHRGIIHRDLKPENIVIGSDLRLKICDFGSARRLGDVTVLTPRATTFLFTAPEMLMGDDTYGAMVDMWAVGCIFFEMVEKKNPFATQHGGSVMSLLKEIFRIIGKPKEGSKLFSLRHYPKDEHEYQASDIVLSLVPSLDADGNDLLKKFLAVDPLDRITAEEALNHPYLKVSSVIGREDKVDALLTGDAAQTAKRKRSRFHD